MALSPEREGRLTASWHAEALGYGYNSAAKNWRRWHGLEPPDERASGFMEWGTAHEADALGFFEAHTGSIVARAGDNQLWTPWEDWCGCTTDGLVDDGIVEAKCPREVPSEPKEAWLVQVNSQIHITGSERGYVVAWSPGEAAVWLVSPTKDYWRTAEPTLKAYWRMLSADKPPGRQKKSKVILDFKWERV